jgi:hypothetical protein
LIPWGYVRDPETGEVVPDPERATLVLAMFERYATGQESDRTIAEWLNAKGVRTTRGRTFGADTVREMLVNASYCGYVCALRDKRREIRGGSGHRSTRTSPQLFDRVWQGGCSIVAVKRRAPFARYFQTVADIQALKEVPETPTGVPRCRRRERRGVKPANDTSHRDQAGSR